ncbi:DUF669 domain-containing protein [Levilactobacillus enshiensis]|uniref:DUF669 domain-containing protein n=1 Tax=Levilactobacillus enshiensis TaxID=2590213 RepID=UPI00117B9177|nr:DUF669 domain-containing protein [Levilactobacillus enshiensis]
MSLFTTDSNNVFGTGVQEAGSYNVQIIKAEAGKANSGREKLTLDYQVLDGKYAGGEIRYQTMTWINDDNEKLKQSIRRFNTLVVALGVGDGVKIESIPQLAKSVLNKKLTVDVDWAEPNNKGNVYLEVRGYHLLDPEGSKPNGVRRPNESQPSGKGKGTAAPSATSSDPFANTGDSIDISEDDLPF